MNKIKEFRNLGIGEFDPPWAVIGFYLTTCCKEGKVSGFSNQKISNNKPQ
jgi:hypothetical protein